MFQQFYVNAVCYIDFIKQVVENGVQFTKEHFFMLLNNLDGDEIQQDMITSTLNIIAEELQVTEGEYVQFIQGIKDAELQKAFLEVRT